MALKNIKSFADDYKLVDLVVKDVQFTISVIGSNFYIRRSDSDAAATFNFLEIEEFNPEDPSENYLGTLRYVYVKEIKQYYPLFKLAIEKYKKLSLFI